MKFGISEDARPQAGYCCRCGAIDLALVYSFAEVLTYPFRIFVTFIHEGGHAIAALLTGNSVESLSIATMRVVKLTPRKAALFLRCSWPAQDTSARWSSARPVGANSQSRRRSRGVSEFSRLDFSTDNYYGLIKRQCPEL